MLYVSKIDKANSLVHITDTDDGAVDIVSQRQLKEIAKLGVVINGVTCADEKLCVKVVKQVKAISSLVAKLTTFRNYEERGHFRFNSEYNICWIFKESKGGISDDAQVIFIEKVNCNPGMLLYVLPSVTSLYDLFSGCKIKNLDLSSFNTINVTDMSYMFFCCQDKSLDLSHFDTRNVTDMGTMFAGCQAESLDLSSFDTRNVINMYGMFANCHVESLDLSSFNTRNVTDMSYMFKDCKVEILDLSSFDTRNVTDMRNMFYMCQVEVLNLSSFDTRNVIDMSDMFADCQVENLDLSSFDMSRITDMTCMFDGCKISRVRVKDVRIIEQLKKDGFKGEIIRV